MAEEKLFPLFYFKQKLNKPTISKADISLRSEGISCSKDIPFSKDIPVTKDVPDAKAIHRVKTQKKYKALPKDQLLLDAGQKRFGVIQCLECKLVFHTGDPDEEISHLNYHNSVDILKFGGWKHERVVRLCEPDRIIQILPGDPKIWWKKVNGLMEVVNRDLGYFDMELNVDKCQVYLYIKSKAIAGCVIAESKTEAYKLISSEGIDLCSERKYSIKCGVSRIWVSQAHRNNGIATTLMDCLKANFVYGHYLQNTEIAFSSPTALGKKFATNYFKTPNFFIYT